MLESTNPLEIIGWTRVVVLVLCFGGAAWLDHKTRRVSNEWWWSWSKPAIFLLILELLLLEADWMIWLTASAALSFASTALIGRPDMGDLLRGSLVDWLVSIWYLAGVIGLTMGALTHGPILIDYFDTEASILLEPEAERLALLWAQMLLIGVVLVFFELAWRFRMLHGGADAKAMMLATVLIPSWKGASFPLFADVHSTAIPPAISLMIWAGFAFLTLPLIMLFRNIKSGDLFPLSMSWHAYRMPLSRIPESHVWLLEEVIDKPDGSRGVLRKMRPVRGSRAETAIDEVIEELVSEGKDKAWVTAKYPFLLFIFPAILPMILVGDPVSWAIENLL